MGKVVGLYEILNCSLEVFGWCVYVGWQTCFIRSQVLTKCLVSRGEALLFLFTRTREIFKTIQITA